MSIINKFYFLIFSLIFCFFSCSHDDCFRIEGKLSDGSSHIIELVYYNNGAFEKIITHSDEKGKFIIDGVSTVPTLAFMTISGELPAINLIVKNGDRLNVEISDISDSATVKIKGNKSSEIINDFDRETLKLIQEGKNPEVNIRVADFIKNNPKEIASAALLITRFETRGNELQADSLLGLISPDVRPQAVMLNFTAALANQLSTESRADLQSFSLYDSRDTTIRFSPHRQSYALLAFIDAKKDMRDSIIPFLKEMNERWPEKRFIEIEISMALDSAKWKQSIANDSADWIRAWMPGTVASSNFRKLSVKRIPFFIIADSTGRQLYRGSSITDAERRLNQMLNHNIE